MEPGEVDSTAVHAAIEAMDEPLRKIGVYVATAMDTGQGPVIVDALVGDVAMSDRVQNPNQAASDSVLRQMEHEQGRAEYDEVKRRLAEGGPLLEDD